MQDPRHITLVGCGNMGRSMLEGWRELEEQFSFTVFDPALSNQDIKALQSENIIVFNDKTKLSGETDFLVMAVKPQIMGEACSNVKHMTNDDTVILSIAAGKTIDSFENIFGKQQPVIRTMPNTPAAIGKGAIAGYANNTVTKTQKTIAEKLLAPLGLFKWVEEETQLDAVTALSGSGPAYVFLFLEALRDAGETLGLPEDLARDLARQTVLGAAELANQSSDVPFETLRENVTSPGGTTQAALNVLMEQDSLKELCRDAMTAAMKRSQELSG